MPRARAQRRATDGLLALGDDALRCALTFLTPSACALGPGATSKAMREVATSRQLEPRASLEATCCARRTTASCTPWPRRSGRRNGPRDCERILGALILLHNPHAYVCRHCRCASRCIGLGANVKTTWNCKANGPSSTFFISMQHSSHGPLLDRNIPLKPLIVPSNPARS